MDQSLRYFDTLRDREYMMSDGSSMSLWGSMPQLYKAPASIQPQAQRQTTPSTPPYSQTLALENQMVGPHMTPIPQGLVGGNHRPHLAATMDNSSTTVVSVRSNSNTGKRRKNFVDPCALAPLKKRRIQVDLLAPDDRDKVLSKREKNKVAAEKCRVKRRVKVEQTRAEYDDYLEINESLNAEVKRLKEEQRMLQDLLEGHKCVQAVHS